MRDYQRLEIWQRSHKLTLRVYNLTQSFPKEELYGLVSQMRRSASSIPTNIAEGCGRNSFIELNRFLVIAAGSSSELQYQFILSKDLKYIDDSIFKELFDEVTQIRKMIYSYCEKLKLISDHPTSLTPTPASYRNFHSWTLLPYHQAAIHLILRNSPDFVFLIAHQLYRPSFHHHLL